jgi:hypothetical protein
VHVIQTGVNAQPSIMVVYDDPEPVPDSLLMTETRPRQLIVILDKSVYGYRQSYHYSSLGLRPPRLTYLDAFDTNNDGKAEIFFGTGAKQKNGETYDGIFVLRAEGEGWRPFMEGLIRCR